MRKYSYTLFVLLMVQVSVAQITYPTQGQSTYIITNGQTISVTNKQSFIFGPGTHIQSGANFMASIIDNTTANDNYTPITPNNQNYVFTRSYQTAMNSFNASNAKEGDVIESITYFDGLGRPMQQNAIKASPDVKDIITHIAYDSYGRQDKDWLPYYEPTGTLGTYRGNRAAATQSYYKTNYAADFTSLTTANTNAYSQKEFETSPLNRVLKQAAPGQDWKLGNNHEIGFEYESNTTNEVHLFEVTTSFANNTYTPTLAANGHYSPGELYKTITKDENWTTGTDHTTEEFTNKSGQVVLKRTYNNGAHDTYYVYDNFANLTYVLPPKVNTGNGVSTTELNELCYQYKYDQRNRLVEKKIPGKGWEFIVYNKLDQPIMTQDANLKNNNQLLFTKYDAFGRVTYTGIDTGNTNGRASLQSSADSENNQYESRTSGTNTYVGTSVYYTKTSYPTSFDKVYTINYYDTYVDTDGLSVPVSVFGQATISNAKGLATVSKVRVLDTDDWITTITGYDAKGRAIYTASKNNYLNTTDIVEIELDFAGKVLETKTNHTKGTNTPIVTIENFSYDHAGRLLKQEQKINNQSTETITENGYDNLGQLVEKKVGGGLQTVDYKYNVRGWLKTINQDNNNDNDLFNFGINYNATTLSGATALFNGNISETHWETANDNIARNYNYRYDPLNRIISATGGSNTNYDVSNITYDKNGNIQTLNRNGYQNSSTFTNMDVLDYDYDSGNKLTKVTDGGNGAHGFKDGTNTNDDFEYDENGNLKIDRNKGITSVTYNHLDLPEQVNFGSQNIQYVYSADGTKLKRTSSTGTETLYADAYIYEGAVGNAQLQFFTHAEGYVMSEGNDWRYVYQYKDHLGNIRLSYTEDPNGGLEIVEDNAYYPFGLKMRGFNGNVSPLGNDVAQRWKFGGKEFDESLDIDTYDFGARNYDPTIGRWMNVDPLAEQMRRHSPYNYAFNNPIFFIDPDGMAPDSWYRDEEGNVQHTDQATSEEEFNNSGIEGEYIAEEFVGIDQNQGVTKFNNDGTTSSSSQDEIGEGDTVVAVESKGVTIEGSEESKAPEGSREAQLGAAVVVSQGDSPLLGPGDVLALGMLAKVLHNMVTGADEVQTSMQVLEFAKSKKGKSAEVEGAEHTSGKRASTKKKHEKGQTRKQQKNRDKKRNKPNWKQY